MKECKEKATLPYYRDGYGVWHHLDDTHDKVYELNKQMCDIGKTLSNPLGTLSEETKALELTKKGNIMEEKKTKTMTKAEAFEYLKGKRVACDSSNEELVQRKLFEVGIRWRGGKNDVTSFAPFLFINPNGITHCGSREWFDLHDYEEISVDDILSIEIVEEKNGEEAALDLISTVGARLSKVLRDMEGHKHVVITEDGVILYEEGMCLFHSDPF